jgi:hypothetical protein
MAIDGEKTKTLLPKAGDVGEAPPSIAASEAGNGVPVPVLAPPSFDPLAATPEPPPTPLDAPPDPLPAETLPVDALPVDTWPELLPVPAPLEDPLVPLDEPEPPTVPVDPPVPPTALPAVPDPDWLGPFPEDEPQPATAATSAPATMSAGADEGRGKGDEMTFIQPG